ncbi:armadillo-type protein [Hyaloraphidium curvatum]|nr:armadillo-type protein [Hyaloraphidium curvatum]
MMGAGYDQAVFEALSGCLDPAPNVRMAAELQIKHLMASDDFAVVLVQIALAQNAPWAQRQLAAVTLKNLTDRHWSPNNDKFEPPEISEATKTIVKDNILMGLADPLPKMRAAMAQVVSKIAHTDWPETWPSLLDNLVANLRSDDPNRVHGTMRVLVEFMKSDITDQQFPHVHPVLFPELYRILCTENTYSPQTRGRAVAIFRLSVDMLDQVKLEFPDAPKLFLKPLLPTWMEAFQKILTTSSADSGVGEVGLRIEILKALTTLVNTFLKLCGPYLQQCLAIAGQNLRLILPRYVAEVVNAPEDGDDDALGDRDSDGEVIRVETLLYQYFEFLGAMGQSRQTRKLFSAGGFLPDLVKMLIGYAMLTNEQAEAWGSDVNQYVLDEDDETYSFNVRIAASELLANLGEAFGVDLLNGLIAGTHALMGDANDLRSRADPTWWKPREASLLSIGKLADELMEAMQQNQVQFDIAGLFSHVVLDSMKASDCPFLQGRAIWFASRFSSVLPAELAQQYVAAAASAASQSDSVPVRICGVKAIQAFSLSMDSAALQPYQQQMLDGLLALMPNASEEIAVLVLETLPSVLKIDARTTAAYYARITDLTLELWSRYHGDHLFSSIVDDVFEVLASNELCAPQMQDKAIPLLLQAISVTYDPSTTASLISGAMDILGTLIKGSQQSLADGQAFAIYNVLFPLLLETSDPNILQSGQVCLRWIVQCDIEKLLKWTDGKGVSGMHNLMLFMSKLLASDNNESASAFIGDLITKVIEKAGPHLQPVLPDLLTAVARRLEAAQTSTFVQSLSQVFLQLLQTQAETVVSFLSGLTINGKNGLEIFLRAWCENYQYFQGYYVLKLNAISMTKLFLLNNPLASAVTVKGDIVEQPAASGKIKTRSQSRKNPEQYTAIPFPAKAIKLLLWDFKTNLENAVTTASPAQNEPESDVLEEEDGSSEAGDWEDVDEESGLATPDEFTYLSGELRPLAALCTFSSARSAELADEGAADWKEEESLDPDLRNDPIYHTNMKEYLVQFFKSCQAQDLNHFSTISSQYLTDQERKVLHFVLSQ